MPRAALASLLRLRTRIASYTAVSLGYRDVARISATLLAAACGPSLANPPESVPDESMTLQVHAVDASDVSAIAWHEGALWLLKSGGVLVKWLPQPSSMERHLAREAVLAIHRTLSDRLWALTISADTRETKVRELVAHRWVTIFRMPTRHDRSVALTDFEGRPIVTSSSDASWIDGQELRTVRFDHPLRGAIAGWTHVATARSGNHRYLYVGTNGALSDSSGWT